MMAASAATWSDFVERILRLSLLHDATACSTRCVPTYRLHDTTGDDLGLMSTRAERRVASLVFEA